MQKKKVLFVSCFFSPEPTGIGKFNGEMIEWLSGKGYDCTAVVPYPYYPFWEIQKPYKKTRYWYKLEQNNKSNVSTKIYRCPHYIPANPTGKKRIASDLSFFVTAFLQVFLLLFSEKYDYVITVAPSFQLGLLGLIHKKAKGSNLIYHVQDLQIDAAQELGLIKSPFLTRMLMRLERYILKESDIVSSISEEMIRKIKIKYNRQVILLPNWVNTQDFYPIQQKDEIKRQYNFEPLDKIILYSGAIGEKQGLQDLLYAANELSTTTNLKFVICSTGPYFEKLIILANNLGVKNVLFMPLQPPAKFNLFLNLADVHLVLQRTEVNDLMLPSKLTNILAVGGLALVTARVGTSLHSIIANNNIGLLAQQENASSLTITILNAVNSSHDNLKENARKYAEEHLMIEKVLSKYLREIT